MKENLAPAAGVTRHYRLGVQTSIYLFLYAFVYGMADIAILRLKVCHNLHDELTILMSCIYSMVV